MAGFSSIAAGIGALAAAGSGIAANVANNKARAEARRKMAEDREAFERQLQSQRDIAEQTLKQKQTEHADNMRAWEEEFKANKDKIKHELAQAEYGLQLQAQQMYNAQNESNRQLANQKAQLERSINQDASNQRQANYNNKDKGVAGTILTGPGGVDKDELKKDKKTLLGQ